MTRDHTTQVIGAGLAAASLVVLVVLDLAIPGSGVFLASLFALAPLIACAVLPASATGAFAVAAVAAAIASGAWNHGWGSAQQTVRIVDVALVSIAAVVIAAVRVRREHRHARVVVIAEVAQRAVLPTLPNQTGQVAVAARYVSAAQDAVVGGDLYDCYHSDSRVRFLVGDVRGKGIGAVEQAARVIRAFRQAAATRPTLPAVAEEMSSYLAPFFDDEEFVTALLVDVSDPMRVTLVSCGHPAPVLASPDGRVSLLESPAGLPLGWRDDRAAHTAPWSPGDRLLMYTDGLSEARDAHGEFLSPLSLAPAMTARPVDEALDHLLDGVRRHVPGGRLTDDLAVVLLENIGVEARSSPDGSRYAQGDRELTSDSGSPS